MRRDGKGLLKTSAILVAFVGLILIIVTLLTILQTAKHKDFWRDESYEIISLCHFSFGRIAAGETHQANKNPLYFLLQKFSLSQIDSFNSDMLVNVRRVSIAAATLMCASLFFFINARLGLLFAVLVVISLTSQYLFYNFAAESRPYMLWVLLFVLLVIATLKMCLQSYEKNSLKDKSLFCFLALTITLVISLGIIQSITAILTCLFCWYFIHNRPKDVKLLINFAIPLGLLCILIQGYYTFKGTQAFYPEIMESSWDLISQIKKSDISLLKMPPRLLLPQAPRDAYFGAFLSNLFVFVGIGVPFLRWSKRRDLKDKDFFVFILSIVALIQVAATIVIILLIALLHYWFVQRLFLYLITCHAILATMGAYFLFSLNKKILGPFLKTALLILFCLSLNWHWQYYSQYDNVPPADSCSSLESYLDVNWQKVIEKNPYIDYDYDPSGFFVNDLDVQGLHKSLQANRKPDILVREMLAASGKELPQITEQDFIAVFNKILRMPDFQARIDAEIYKPSLTRQMQIFLVRAQMPGEKLSESEYLRLNKALLLTIYPPRHQENLDYIVELNQILNNCYGTAIPHDAQRVYLWQDAIGKLSLNENGPINGGRHILMCGRPVYFTMKK